jgi:3-deoxy-D-manno-octulosonic-acid transferase
LDERRVVDVPALLGQLGFPPGARLLVGGSTHAGEEAILADIFQRLRPQFPDLYLILVPRHFERGREVGRALSERGVRFVYRKDIGANHRFKDVDCLVVNTTGELKLFYEHASVVFVGKSLTAEGGQNPIEPGALAKPILFGPHMQNFEAIARALVERDGAVQVSNAAELETALTHLLSDPARCEELGRNALQVVRENLGAIERTVDMIVEHLDTSEIYVAPKREAALPGSIAAAS